MEKRGTTFQSSSLEESLFQEYLFPYYKLVFNSLAEENVTSRLLSSAVPKFITPHQLWKVPKIISDRIYDHFKHQELHYFGINSFLDLYEILTLSSFEAKVKFLFKLMEVQGTGHFTLTQCCKIIAALSHQELRLENDLQTLKFKLYFNGQLSLDQLYEIMNSTLTPFHEILNTLKQNLRIEQKIKAFAGTSKLEGYLYKSLEQIKAKKAYYYKLSSDFILIFKNKQARTYSKAIYIGSLIKLETTQIATKKSIIYLLRLKTATKLSEFYFTSEGERERWKQAIVEATSYRELQDQYEVGEVIGKGRHSIVYRGLHSGIDIAIKAIEKEQLSERELEIFQQEKEILKQCNHQNIVQFYDFFETTHSINFVTKLVQGPTLKQLMRKTSFQEDQIIGILEGIVRALQYLQQRGIVHRDLKPQNIIIQESNQQPVIIDFGLSKQLLQQEIAQEAVGSPHYMASEIISGSGYNEKADIYSLGCIMYELVYGKVPFNKASKEQIFSSIVAQTPDFELPHKVSDKLVGLIQDMLVKDPRERPSIEEIKERL